MKISISAPELIDKINYNDMPAFIYQTPPAPLLVTYSIVKPTRGNFPDMLFLGAILAVLLIIVFKRKN